MLNEGIASVSGIGDGVRSPVLREPFWVTLSGKGGVVFQQTLDRAIERAKELSTQGVRVYVGQVEGSALDDREIFESKDSICNYAVYSPSRVCMLEYANEIPARLECVRRCQEDGETFYLLKVVGEVGPWGLGECQRLVSGQHPGNGGEFWYVYNPAASAPGYRHDTEQSAVTEAKRLSSQHGCQNEDFYVLHAVAKACVKAPEYVSFETP